MKNKNNFANAYKSRVYKRKIFFEGFFLYFFEIKYYLLLNKSLCNLKKVWRERKNTIGK